MCERPLTNFSPRFFIIFAVYLLFQLGSVKSNGEEGFYPNALTLTKSEGSLKSYENCGMAAEIDGNDRTFNPWNVAIFLRKNRKSPFKYFLTGSLSSANTVITGFGGSYGQSSYTNQNKRYFVPPASNFLVAAGLTSTSLLDADEHAQFANVSYIAPQPGNSSHFHFVIFRLERRFNLEGPYVKSVCLSFGLLPQLHALGFAGHLQDIFTNQQRRAVIGGFNNSPKIKEPFPNTVVAAKGSINDACFRSYKYHYKAEPNAGIDCIRGVETYNKSICLTHGSGGVYKSSSFEISFLPFYGPEPRYFLSGAIALIPRRDLQECDEKTLYYEYLIHDPIDWIKDHMVCNHSGKFPCSNETCIALNQLCDGKNDCPGAEDEDPIYCAATNRCRDRSDYQCGYEGKCIRFDQVGDGEPDCPSGSDESEKLLETNRFSGKARTNGNVTCPPLLPTEGVILECQHPENPNVTCFNAPIGSEATVRCARFYSSLQKFNFARMTCYDDGKWKPYRAFLCQPECGVIGKEVVQEYVANGIAVQSEKGFPWHAAIFKVTDKGADLKYICGGSLIERNVVITAAHCTVDSDFANFRILLGSTSIMEHNKNKHLPNMFEVETIWRPYSYDHETRQSDVAVIKLSKPVVYSPTIRPVCYLVKSHLNLPPTNFVGTIPGFGVTETGQISERLNYANLRIISVEECAVQFHDKFCARSKKELQTICYGDSGGGLVFPAEGGSSSSGKFILKGIASELQRPNGFRCGFDSNDTSVFTHLDSHREWLLTTLEDIDVNPDL